MMSHGHRLLGKLILSRECLLPHQAPPTSYNLRKWKRWKRWKREKLPERPGSDCKKSLFSHCPIILKFVCDTSILGARHLFLRNFLLLALIGKTCITFFSLGMIGGEARRMPRFRLGGKLTPATIEERDKTFLNCPVH